MEPDTAQNEVVDWLATSAAHGNNVVEVQQIHTHAAIVFLVGNRAYKMKRAIKYPYLDYSTLELREKNLRRELALNRRTAPDIYRDVIPVRRAPDGSFSIGNQNTDPPVEWLLQMRRFDVDDVLDRAVEHGKIDVALMDNLAQVIARFHASAEVCRDKGGAAQFSKILMLNSHELEELGFLPRPRIHGLTDFSLGITNRHAHLLDERRNQGFVRQCHGDLHLGNIVLIDGTPTLFDCIEFNDDIACIDVLYDIAFLLMDLLHCRLRPFANRLLNSYLGAIPFSELSDTLGALTLLRLFLSCRAAVRAHVTARRFAMLGERASSMVVNDYFELSEQLLNASTPRLVAIGGLSGTGKSTIARLIAPEFSGPVGAIILRTDVIRKQMLGVPLDKPLPSQTYTKELSGRVYGELISLARRALDAGQSVVLDAVFADEQERQIARSTANELNLPFHGIWLSAPIEKMEQRLADRKNDASDATRDVLIQQIRYETGKIDWFCVSTTFTPEVSASQAKALIGRTS